MGSTGHRTLPHPAEVSLQAWAPSREQCLAEMVAALVDSVLDTFGTHPVRRHAFHLRAASDRGLLAALLEEVVQLLDARGEVPLHTHLEVAGCGIAHGWFEVGEASSAEVVGTLPRGVALSGLAMDQDEHGWHGSATVDV